MMCVVLVASCRSASPAPVAVAPGPPKLTFLGVGVLPRQDFQGAPVGGLSALAYDAAGNRYLALSDDRSERAPARIYVLNIVLTDNQPTLTVTGVVTLLDDEGKPFAEHALDPEGLALLSPTRALLSSEGIASRNIQPFVKEVSLPSGKVVRTFEPPPAILLHADGGHGVRENYGLEALALCPGGLKALTLTEGVLAQDGPWPSGTPGLPSRAYMYDISKGSVEQEWRYPLEASPPGALVHGITTALCLDAAGEALVLERSWGVMTGFAIQLFHARVRDGIFVKERVLDLGTLGVPLDNLEGMTLGPVLEDGRQLLLIISDDNFRTDQVTQVLAFALTR